jgi:hypothetical protein
MINHNQIAKEMTKIKVNLLSRVPNSSTKRDIEQGWADVPTKSLPNQEPVTKPRGEKIFSNYPFKRINKWNWIWLWAIPTYVVTDDGYATFFKKFRGITYVTKMEELPSRRKP